MSIAILFYGVKINVDNCSFISNQAQFSGILSTNNLVESLTIINISNILSLFSYASRQNTYLGLDYSQGGAFGGYGYGGKTYFNFDKCFFLNGFSPKGYIFLLCL